MQPLLAMHMANELLSLPVSGLTLLLAAVAVGLAARRLGKTMPAEKWPLMGVMGAFVFAAQMINFTLPLMPGTSGHLGGAVLLAILLGPSAAIVTLAAVLIVQCLLFQDGGLMALGCNIINMGVVPGLAGWWLYRLLLGDPQRSSPARQYLACWVACIVGVAAGAVLVPVEAVFSGRLLISASDFLAAMLGVHLVIGLVEGAITFTVLAYLRRVRPAYLGLAPAEATSGPGKKAVLASILGTALLLGGLVSWFASSHPDGLEWCLARGGGDSGAVAAPTGLAARIDNWQKRWSLMSDYSKRAAPLGEEQNETQANDQSTQRTCWPVADGWKSLAGVLGTLATLAVLVALTAVLRSKRHAPQPH